MEKTHIRAIDYTGARSLDYSEFIKMLNKQRLACPNQWYGFAGTVEGQPVVVKAFDTWLQIYRVNGKDYTGPMEISVKQFKSDLARPFR